jgi:hypothetical protein
MRIFTEIFEHGLPLCALLLEDIPHQHADLFIVLNGTPAGKPDTPANDPGGNILSAGCPAT